MYRIEYMITASPEAFKRHGETLKDLGNGYFRDALSWLHQRHGAANALCSAVHLDESTPHLVAYPSARSLKRSGFKISKIDAHDLIKLPYKMNTQTFKNALHRLKVVSVGLPRSTLKIRYRRGRNPGSARQISLSQTSDGSSSLTNLRRHTKNMISYQNIDSAFPNVYSLLILITSDLGNYVDANPDQVS